MNETRVYGAAAASYAAHSDKSPHNVLYERPAMRSLVGDPAGLQIIDLGCGAGSLIRSFREQGASRVVGIDSDPDLVKIARERLGPSAEVVQHNICVPLPTSWSETFDLAVASLVLHYLDDWGKPLCNIRRLLRPRGRLVFSVSHPMYDASLAKGSYFATESITEHWNALDIDVTTFRRPLQTIFDDLYTAGFRVDRILEPKPDAKMELRDPRLYEQLCRQPLFLLLDAHRV